MKQFFTYAAETSGITVRVHPNYLEDQSDPSNDHYVWSYHIRIENGGAETVQLLSRHWIITDASGHVEQVRGPGVVGETPVLKPGQTFDYVSGCPLPTPSGTMHGSFTMARDGATFEAIVPPFALESPHARATRH